MLRLLADEAAAGEGRLVMVEGPAGIGKSRLLAELRAHAAAAGTTVLAARGSELEREFGFGVVRQLLETLRRGPRGGRPADGGGRAGGGRAGRPAGGRRGRRELRGAARPLLGRRQSRRAPARPALRRRPAVERPRRRCASSPTWRTGSRACPCCWRAACAAASGPTIRRCWPSSSDSRPSPSCSRRRSARPPWPRCCAGVSGSSRARGSRLPCTAAPGATRCCSASSSPPWRTTRCRPMTPMPARSRRSAPVRSRAPSCCGSRAWMRRLPRQLGPSPSSARARATRRSPS